MRRLLLCTLFLMNADVCAASCVTVVGQKAPDFSAKAVINGGIKDISLADFSGKNIILIFYPADFSFICPTELFAFQDKIKEFDRKNTVLIAISVDQVYSHQKFLETPRDKGGIQGITYPIVSDVNKKISNSYMTLDPQEGVALRGVFIIDTDGIVQASSIYNTSIGRDIPEVMRVLDAMLFTKEHGQVCPANWHKGDDGINTNHKDLENYLKKQKEVK